MWREKQEIVDILMRRDGISENEAIGIFNDCAAAIDDTIACGGTLDDVEDIVACELGLEPDFLMAFL